MLYVKNSSLAQTDADYILNKNSKSLQESKNCVVLDIGCGPGNVTYEKILPLLPSTTIKVIGVDILSDNIDYARKHYQTDPRVSFEHLDILTDAIPNEYVGAFDLIISLYCFHFVGNHRKALNNIYKMLKPGGKVLLSFMDKSVISKMYQYVYDNPKWTKYMDNFNTAISKLGSEKASKELFKEIGFHQIEYEEQDKLVLHSEDGFFEILKSLNLYTVPEELEKEFIENHLEYFQVNNHINVDDQGRTQYKHPYTMFVITANKPKHIDVGCGPGNVTYEKILPRLPSTTKKLIGVDILNHYIDYARKHYQIDQRVSYQHLNILTDTIPNEYIGRFDLIVSLYCLHRVGDHRKALNNIYKMLKPGGKVLISFMKSPLISEMFQYVYDNPKWTKYMNNFNNAVFKLGSEEASEELFKKIGFCQIEYEQHDNLVFLSEDCLFEKFYELAPPKMYERNYSYLEALEDVATTSAQHEVDIVIISPDADPQTDEIDLDENNIKSETNLFSTDVSGEIELQYINSSDYLPKSQQPKIRKIDPS
ncbi:hypothetical protein RN001_014415 [Aquatica leii]|uniref:Methyltransferase domain-containing protein n=1 Tax=Aquatica leii TaxID=1421715 RepID=A0AAN7S672_9COLE|nr:hypothetical protein RN001_014415 [Aquatica leii]